MKSAVTIPVIDGGALRSNDPRDLAALSAAIGDAARRVGFFTLVNHGISQALLDEVFAAAATFFALPQAEKDAITLEKSDAYRGYARIGFEKLDPARPGDVKESFNVGREQTAPNQWPELPGFRATLQRYYDELQALIIALHRPIALDLGADEHYFDARFDRALGVLRLLRYPEHPARADPDLFGAAPHTDYGNLTLLAQDGTPGLEVRDRDGAWIDVEPTPGAFVCNIGDALMRWSNDVYISTPHRVVNRAGRERYSVAFFGDPNADALLACLPSCSWPENPPRYDPPITYAQLLQAKYEATYVSS
jgi:isopenicillin N synthase-like dioxygenase